VILLAIDPGLDVAGWAAFDADQVRPGIAIGERCGPALIGWGRITTDPAEQLAARLTELGAEAKILFDRWTFSHALQVLVEQPAHKAVYARNAGAGAAAIHEGLAKLHMAIGAILAVAPQSPPAILLRTPRLPKSRKSAIARAILGAGGTPDEDRSGRTIQDERDAIALGAYYLLQIPRPLAVPAAHGGWNPGSG
jgi:hypothetical protein